MKIDFKSYEDLIQILKYSLQITSEMLTVKKILMTLC